jgi:hypothetical protein
MDEKSTEVEPDDTKHVTKKDNRIPVLLVDSRQPYPELALFALDAIPRAGDLINIAINGKLVAYKVDFVNFNPFNERSQITLGCSFSVLGVAANQPIDLKERMDQVVKGQIQVYEKAQAYSNAMMLAGYAGIFALWTFAKGVLTTKTTNAVIVLIGFSLILYVSWEIVGMLQRAAGAAKFLALIEKAPTDFVQLLAKQEAEERRLSKHYILAWRIVVIPTIIAGYAGALLLTYNAAAGILGFTQWP